jgi:homopolymeric O-antigen transport system permease protein
MQVVLQLFYWLTPIYYQIDMLPENLQKIVLVNPLTMIVLSARKGLITGDEVLRSDFFELGKIFLVCVLILLLGVIFFKKKVSKIAEYY